MVSNKKTVFFFFLLHASASCVSQTLCRLFKFRENEQMNRSHLQLLKIHRLSLAKECLGQPVGSAQTLSTCVNQPQRCPGAGVTTESRHKEVFVGRIR